MRDYEKKVLEKLETLTKEMACSKDYAMDMRYYTKSTRRLYKEVRQILGKNKDLENYQRDLPEKLKSPVKGLEYYKFLAYFLVPFVSAIIYYLFQTDMLYVALTSVFIYPIVVISFLKYGSRIRRNQLKIGAISYEIIAKLKKKK